MARVRSAIAMAAPIRARSICASATAMRADRLPPSSIGSANPAVVSALRRPRYSPLPATFSVSTTISGLGRRPATVRPAVAACTPAVPAAREGETAPPSANALKSEGRLGHRRSWRCGLSVPARLTRPEGRRREPDSTRMKARVAKRSSCAPLKSRPKFGPRECPPIGGIVLGKLLVAMTGARVGSSVGH